MGYGERMINVGATQTEYKKQEQYVRNVVLLLDCVILTLLREMRRKNSGEAREPRSSFHQHTIYVVYSHQW